MGKKHKNSFSRNAETIYQLMDAGRVEEAILLSERLIQSNNRDAAVLSAYAQALHRAGRVRDGANAFAKAFELEPKEYRHALNAGELFRLCDEFHNAEFYLLQSIKVLPTSLAYNNLALVYSSLSRVQDAIRTLHQAIDIEPDLFIAVHNLAAQYSDFGDYDRAIEYYQKALMINPAVEQTILGLALAHGGKNDYKEAVGLFKRLIASNPTSTLYRYNYGIALLKSGSLVEGFIESAWRAKHVPGVLLESVKPLWDGQYLENETIFIYNELQGFNGFGDAIFYAQYLSAFIDKYKPKQVMLGVQEPLHEIFNASSLMKNYSSVIKLSIVERKDIYYGYHLPLFDVAKYVIDNDSSHNNTIKPLNVDKSDIPAEKIEQVKNLLANKNSGKKLKIGITLTANKGHTASIYRSLRFSHIVPLLDSLAGSADFYLVQKDGLRYQRDEDEFNEFAKKGGNLFDLRDELDGVMTTIALLSQLDCFVTVDTLMVHLCGIYSDVKTCLLVPYQYDWKWAPFMEDGTHSSLFYPNVKLFRQDSNVKDWRSAVNEVVSYLRS